MYSSELCNFSFEHPAFKNLQNEQFLMKHFEKIKALATLEGGQAIKLKILNFFW